MGNRISNRNDGPMSSVMQDSHTCKYPCVTQAAAGCVSKEQRNVRAGDASVQRDDAILHVATLARPEVLTIVKDKLLRVAKLRRRDKSYRMQARAVYTFLFTPPRLR